MKSRPVGRPSTFKKTEAQQAALDLFWERGYEETSLTDLTQTMGINRSSFYRTFESKELLFKACVEDYVRETLGFIPDALDLANIEGSIDHFFKNAILNMTRHEPAKGCLLVQAMLNCDERNKPIAELLKSKRTQLENMVRKRIQQAQVKSEIKAGQSAVDITKMLITLYCGLSIQAASGASQKELRNAVKLVTKAINF
jgi:AcrR family transcriptional regulator